MNEESEILIDLIELLNNKRNDYVDAMNDHEIGSSYWHYCHGKKEMIEEIVGYINNLKKNYE